jgi:hypothetical protein
MTVWQIAAGSFGRDYKDYFLRHGLAFVGGEPQCRLINQVQPCDVVILKRGVTQIAAVGEVVERDGRCRGRNDKPWLRDFDGWDLGAWCNVEWHVPDPEVPVIANGLTMGAIQRVGAGNTDLIDLVRGKLAEWPRRTHYEPEPEPTKTVTDNDLIGHLVQFGLRPGAAEDLTQAMRRIRLLAGFYLGRDWSLTKEHEARSFLVLPLLLALGWAEQRIQIERSVPRVGLADIACFRSPVTRLGQDEDCVLIIETKGLAQGLDYAPEQAPPVCGDIPILRCGPGHERLLLQGLPAGLRRQLLAPAMGLPEHRESPGPVSPRSQGRRGYRNPEDADPGIGSDRSSTDPVVVASVLSFRAAQSRTPPCPNFGVPWVAARPVAPWSGDPGAGLRLRPRTRSACPATSRRRSPGRRAFGRRQAGGPRRTGSRAPASAEPGGRRDARPAGRTRHCGGRLAWTGTRRWRR